MRHRFYDFIKTTLIFSAQHEKETLFFFLLVSLFRPYIFVIHITEIFQTVWFVASVIENGLAMYMILLHAVLNPIQYR